MLKEEKIENIEEKESAMSESNIESDQVANKSEQSAGENQQLESEKVVVELLSKLTLSEDKYLRITAEYENFRKRVIREKSDIRINSQFEVLNQIVPVLDHFELALGSVEQSHNLDKLYEGMKLIKAEFEKALDTLGVELINAVGKPFDPRFHEAISHEASENIEKDLVLKQWRSGYKMGERLIRPASVIISSGKSEQ